MECGVMPKETIHPSTPRPDVTVHAELGWEPLGWVQLRLRDDGDTPSVLAVDLDRHQINRLIKHARRARDAAYGRDE
jgi:hypothetical protein